MFELYLKYVWIMNITQSLIFLSYHGGNTILSTFVVFDTWCVIAHITKYFRVPQLNYKHTVLSMFEVIDILCVTAHITKYFRVPQLNQKSHSAFNVCSHRYFLRDSLHHQVFSDTSIKLRVSQYFRCLKWNEFILAKVI